MEKIAIHTPYITLGQLLKLVDLVSGGAETKQFVATHRIDVDGESENRRGRKLYPGHKIEIDGRFYLIEKKE